MISPEEMDEARGFLKRLGDIVFPLAQGGSPPRGPPQRVTVETASGEANKEEIVGGEGSTLPPERFSDAGRDAREIVEQMLDLDYNMAGPSDPRRKILEVGTILSQLGDSIESIDRVVELATRMGKQLKKAI